MNLIIAVILIAAAGGIWTKSTEDSCWKSEATQVFRKYGSLKTRADVLHVVGKRSTPHSTSIEVVEKDPNGCSLGSNGQTIVRFTFDNENALKTIRVFRHYLAADHQMELIEEKQI